MTAISIDSAYELARQRQRELEHAAALARAGRQAPGRRRWNVMSLLRRRTAGSGGSPRPYPGRPVTPLRPDPSPVSASRQTSETVVCRDTEPGRAA